MKRSKHRFVFTFIMCIAKEWNFLSGLTNNLLCLNLERTGNFKARVFIILPVEMHERGMSNKK